MENCWKRCLLAGILLLALFAVFTALVLRVDVQLAGESGTRVGFASVNVWFHEWTGVHGMLYTVTDWLGLVPVLVCLLFGGLGLEQLIRRRSLVRVDADILLLGAYYMLVIVLYLAFDLFPVNARPVLIEGRLEASYPSSTTLLTLSVMPTLVLQSWRRLRCARTKWIVAGASAAFSLFMVTGRLISGVHWLTDIAGGVLLSAGLFCIYGAVVIRWCKENR